MQILVLIGLYFLKCTTFDQLILRKIIKIIATTCQILTLKYTKIDFGWGSAPDSAVELTTLPSPLAGFKGPTSKERAGEGRRGEGSGGDARPVCLLVLTIMATGLTERPSAQRCNFGKRLRARVEDRTLWTLAVTEIPWPLIESIDSQLRQSGVCYLESAGATNAFNFAEWVVAIKATKFCKIKTQLNEKMTVCSWVLNKLVKFETKWCSRYWNTDIELEKRLLISWWAKSIRNSI